uniref:SP110 nuclear body protein, tandem duplicate 1 n=1 Tax=Lepisosteus oculatus TaxID=7918 RepID=W5N1A6_LEPOC
MAGAWLFPSLEMDGLAHLGKEQLRQVFRGRKSEIASIQDPFLLLSDLRDNDIIPEGSYKELLGLPLKERVEGMYKLLERLERKTPERIPAFMQTLLKEHIRKSSPELQALHLQLREGTSPTGDRETGPLQHIFTSFLLERQLNKKYISHNLSCSTGTPQPSGLRNPESPSYHKIVVPVECGHKRGLFYADKLQEGEPCIFAGGRWLSPPQFEVLGGKGKAKSWKRSIFCRRVPLGELLQENTGEPAKCPLTCVLCVTAVFQGSTELPSQSQSDSSDSEDSDLDWREDKDRKEEEDSEQSSSSSSESEWEGEGGKERERVWNVSALSKVLAVSCGSATGKLHKERFANEFRGRCIRMPDKWCTPLEFYRTGMGDGASDTSWAREIRHDGKPLASLIEKGVLETHEEDCACPKCVSTQAHKSQEDNDDQCQACGLGGDLLCCDGCPRSFHRDCHLPPITVPSDPEAKWICTLCEPPKTQKPLRSFQSETAVLRLKMEEHRAKCLYLLLTLYCHENSGHFSKNPCSLEKYCDIIKHPKWLDQVKKGLLQQKYQQVGQFVQDVRLIFQNCAQYNKDNKAYRIMGRELQGIFESKLRDVFPIRCRERKCS